MNPGAAGQSRIRHRGEQPVDKGMDSVKDYRTVWQFLAVKMGGHMQRLGEIADFVLTAWEKSAQVTLPRWDVRGTRAISGTKQFQESY